MKTKNTTNQSVIQDNKINTLTSLTVGNNAEPGRITVNTPKTNGKALLGNGGKETIVLDGKDSKITISGNGGYSDGYETIQLNGQTGEAKLGGTAAMGKLKLTDSKGQETASLVGNGVLTLGGQNYPGNISLKNSDGEQIVSIDSRSGNLILGGPGASGDIFIKNSNDIDTIKINGTTGDIEFLNADFAEDFDVCEKIVTEVKPGTVMILNDSGKLVPCESDYDPRAVGIIAGAGSYKSGIVMDKNGKDHRLPIAMMGKVYCLVSAEEAPVRIGDMLTTSSKSGHAMKSSDRNRAFGTVIGKALAELSEGTGLIPVLVNLQ